MAAADDTTNDEPAAEPADGAEAVEPVSVEASGQESRNLEPTAEADVPEAAAFADSADTMPTSAPDADEEAIEPELVEEQAELMVSSQVEPTDMAPDPAVAPAALQSQTEPVAPGRLAARMWITTALLCAAPITEATRRTWRFSPGGPLHPLKPTVASASFPAELPLAIHLRVQGTGEGQLTVWMEDEQGEHLQWNDGSAEPVRFPVTLLQSGDALLEFANTLIIPGVRFPGPGRYRAVVQLGSQANAEPDLDALHVPLTMFTPRQLPQLGQAEDPSLDSLLQELRGKFTVDVRRALRYSAVEARRLGRGSIFVDHLLIALGRTLGPRAGLARVEVLRDIVEMSTGLYAPFVGRREIRVSEPLAQLIRNSATNAEGALGAPGLMRAVLSEPQGLKTYQWLVEQAVLLSRTPPL
jgi:hypothetical protein